jgi:hypothetical protein
MSRILFVTNDPRPVPNYARWWRLRLQPNRDGIIHILRLDIKGLADWNQRIFPSLMPWSGSVEFFDGRDDWSFPHDWAFDLIEDPTVWPSRLIQSIFQREYLDVLGTYWALRVPYPEWEPLTDIGDLVHPTRAEHTFRVASRKYYPPQREE